MGIGRASSGCLSGPVVTFGKESIGVGSARGTSKHSGSEYV